MSGGQPPPNPSNSSSQSAQSRPVSPAINGWSAEYLDAQYQQFKRDPASVGGDMAAFFQGFDLAIARPGGGASGGSGQGAVLQSAAEDLIGAYRALGHLIATIDPFGRARARPKALSLEYFGLSQADLNKTIHTDLVPGGAATLKMVIDHLEKSYCGSIGVEFMHIPSDDERVWFRRRFEGDLQPKGLDNAERVRLLEQLTAVEQFEAFLAKRFLGKKRFSIEGGEATVPLLKFMTDRLGELGTQEIIIGMAHRGRLAMLRNYLGKDLGKMFTEFKEYWSEGIHPGGGDVKYHRGYSGDQVMPDGRVVHLSLLNNPSHLESQDAVVMGRCRAKQDLVSGGIEEGFKKVASLAIHGDAALPGQGVVSECLNMQKLEGYAVGGTLHVVINNLVGFTTDPEDSRSTEYCTDIAKIINAPVLHVNGDDPEAVVRAARLAAEYRAEFKKDVFVDMVCFRRYGHNEADEPAFTQPQLYALVRAHPGTPETYRRTLIESGVVTQPQAEQMAKRVWDDMDVVYVDVVDGHKGVDPVPPPGGGLWKGLDGKYTFESPKTAVDAKTIAEVCAAMGRAPEGFNVHPKLKGMMQARVDLPKHNKIAHNDAEMLAIGTLLLDGVMIRLSGQDSRRGTFTTRHAVLRDEKTNERYTPLDHIREGKSGGQAKFHVWDSPLSEYSVMGFDYGYSRANPLALVMWEAQFGDFANGAQIMIDQYIASSEVKWNRWGGLVLLLPHGYEGQGPEHSSARLERFLQLCADENMEVVYPSTAAQTFHMLRRHMMRNFRKPLVVMTPKKFLRIETSTVDELSTGSFQHVIDDPAYSSAKGGTGGLPASGVTQVVYCTGKIYHEMAERREKTGRKDVALIRIEQLYPFHTKAVKRVDEKYPKSAKRMWAQEEPRNQGAYLYIADKFLEEFGWRPTFIGRPACASPATAMETMHVKQQDKILTEAVAPLPPEPKKADDPGHSDKANGTASKPTSASKSKH